MVENTTKLTLEVHILRFNHVIKQKCTGCGKSIASGRHLISVVIFRDNISYKYILGTYDLSCCDSHKAVAWKLLSSKSAASELRKKLIEQIKARGTTEGIPLIAWSTPF